MAIKARFTIGGAAVGLLCGLGYMVYIFTLGPGRPSLVEFMVHATVVGVVMGFGAAGGFLLCLLRRKK